METVADLLYANVTFSGAEDDDLRTVRVILEPGVTDESDIPVMLACRATGRPSDSVYFTVYRVEYEV